jgi:hypothetical protein
MTARALRGPALALAAALALAGCGPAGALLTGESWPPRPPVLPAEAVAAVRAEEAWEGATSAAAEPAVLIARTGPEWDGIWQTVGRPPPVPLPEGRSAVAIFAGPRSAATRVVTLGVSVTPPATIDARPAATVRYVVFGADALAGEVAAGGPSPWAVRLVPIAEGNISVTRVPLDTISARPVVPPASTAAALADGTAFEGTSAVRAASGSYVARNRDEWERLWALAGTPPPGPLPPDAAAVGVFSGEQSIPGGRVFTADLEVERTLGPADAAVLRYATNAPDGASPADAVGRTPWAIRLVPGRETEVFLVDLRAEEALPAWWRQPVFTMVRGGREASRTRVTRSPPRLEPPRAGSAPGAAPAAPAPRTGPTG